jgi:hypothetical protein
MLSEALLFGALALVPLGFVLLAIETRKPVMKVTIYYTDPPGGTEVYTNVTHYSNDGKVVKLTGKNAAGEVVTVEFNWASIRKVVQEHSA